LVLAALHETTHLLLEIMGQTQYLPLLHLLVAVVVAGDILVVKVLTVHPAVLEEVLQIIIGVLVILVVQEQQVKDMPVLEQHFILT